MSLFALIPAAGTGSRFGGAQSGVPKQYVPLEGRPMLWHAVRSLLVPAIDLVFVVLSPGDVEFPRHDWSAFGRKVQPLYCGGASRAESVHNGMLAAMEAVNAEDWVLVHDAARPCLPAAALDRLIVECSGDPVGGLLALPVADTVKRSGKDEDGTPRVVATEDRSLLWLAQTPQMFRAGLLAQALQQLRGAATDEASAIEALGLRPRLVRGSRDNLKVTYPEDLRIAGALIAMQRRGNIA